MQKEHLFGDDLLNLISCDIYENHPLAKCKNQESIDLSYDQLQIYLLLEFHKSLPILYQGFIKGFFLLILFFRVLCSKYSFNQNLQSLIGVKIIVYTNPYYSMKRNRRKFQLPSNKLTHTARSHEFCDGKLFRKSTCNDQSLTINVSSIKDYNVDKNFPLTLRSKAPMVYHRKYIENRKPFSINKAFQMLKFTEQFRQMKQKSSKKKSQNKQINNYQQKQITLQQRLVNESDQQQNKQNQILINHNVSQFLEKCEFNTHQQQQSWPYKSLKRKENEKNKNLLRRINTSLNTRNLKNKYLVRKFRQKDDFSPWSLKKNMLFQLQQQISSLGLFNNEQLSPH